MFFLVQSLDTSVSIKTLVNVPQVDGRPRHPLGDRDAFAETCLVPTKENDN